MVLLDDATLPAPQQLAVAWSPRQVRRAMLALLVFDALLARLVAGASEPLLGQMRLAWWREQLAREPDARQRGNPELAALGTHWRGEEAPLLELIDGWEHLLGVAPLPEEAIASFTRGRGAGFAGLARLGGAPQDAEAAAEAGRCWALADLAFHVREPAERDSCRRLFRECAASRASVALPRRLRGLSVLAALAKRAIERDEPMLQGRGAALTALRVGLLGR
jgi:phytoene synthase